MAKSYKHGGKKAVQRPDIGLEQHVMKRDNTKKPDQSYPQKPSLATEAVKGGDPNRPVEVDWNENPDREFAEFLIGLAFEAAKVGGGGGRRIPGRMEVVEDGDGDDRDPRRRPQPSQIYVRSIPKVDGQGRAEGRDDSDATAVHP